MSGICLGGRYNERQTTARTHEVSGLRTDAPRFRVPEVFHNQVQEMQGESRHVPQKTETGERMTTKNLIESLFFLFVVWSIRIAFLAAGCWMMHNGWYGCGLTTVILSVLVGGHHDDDEDDERKEKDLSDAESCFNCAHHSPMGETKTFSCLKYKVQFPIDQTLPCVYYARKEEGSK